MDARRLALSFARSQQAEGRSQHTIRLYSACIARLISYAEAETGSSDLSVFTRRLLREFYAARLATCANSTVSIDYRVHAVFFRWLVSEGEAAANPLDGLRGPRVPVRPVPVLSDGELAALVRSCEGSKRRDRRDMAILRLLIDSGLRRGEVAGLSLGDVAPYGGDFLLTVTGKGRTRAILLGAKASLALDRWLRVLPDAPALWRVAAIGIRSSWYR
jgi:integrase/recombinase XerC